MKKPQLHIVTVGEKSGVCNSDMHATHMHRYYVIGDLEQFVIQTHHTIMWSINVTGHINIRDFKASARYHGKAVDMRKIKNG